MAQDKSASPPEEYTLSRSLLGAAAILENIAAWRPSEKIALLNAHLALLEATKPGCGDEIMQAEAVLTRAIRGDLLPMTDAGKENLARYAAAVRALAASLAA